MKKDLKYHYEVNDKTADEFFAEIEKAENFVDLSLLEQEYGDEQFIYEGTPYSYILDFLSKFAPRQKEIVYDLGSGYGRFVIFCAMNSDAECRGIEISDKRNRQARDLAKRLGLRNIKFYTGNVLDFDISDGDYFFLFNPFKPRTLHQVGDKLKEVAKKRTIKIATWGGASNDFFRERDWLEEIKDLDPHSPIEYFISTKSLLNSD